MSTRGTRTWGQRVLPRTALLGVLLALGLGLACDGGGCTPDPKTQARLQAAEAWDQGKAALDRGDHPAALDAFAQAQALDPDSAVLVAWQARALELSGDVDGALALLGTALQRFPQDADLRYNRAALRARTGDLDGAAADLHVLISSGAVDPEEAGRDPDLVLLRKRPELAALVPGAVLAVDLRGEDGSVLLGELYTAELYADLPVERDDLSVRSMKEPTGLLRRERVVEDHLSEGSYRVQARIEHSWRAVAPGQGVAGPWLLTVGGSSALTERMDVDIVAVGNRGAPSTAAGPEDLVLPSAVVGSRLPPWAGMLLDRFAVLVRPGDQVELLDPTGAPLQPAEQWELRRQAQPVWNVLLFDAPSGSSLTVRNGGSVVLQDKAP